LDKMPGVQALHHQLQLVRALRSQQEEVQELVFKGRRPVWVDQDFQADSQAHRRRDSQAEADLQEDSHLPAFLQVVARLGSVALLASNLLLAVVGSHRAVSQAGRWMGRYGARIQDLIHWVHHCSRLVLRDRHRL
jgi:hypothetical protein